MDDDERSRLRNSKVPPVAHHQLESERCFEDVEPPVRFRRTGQVQLQREVQADHSTARPPLVCGENLRPSPRRRGPIPLQIDAGHKRQPTA